MEDSVLLRPLFWLTKLGLATLYILREWWYRPNYDRIEGPKKTLPKKSVASQQAAPLPSHRYEYGAAAVENHMYVVGGVFQSSVWLPTGKFEAYESTTDNWQKLPRLPHVVHHPGVTSDERFVYVVGGCGIRIQPLSLAWRYDPNRTVWERLPNMPTRRGALGLVHINAQLYAVGGADYGKKYAILERFDTHRGQWEKLADMPTPREHLTAVACQEKLHVLGGYNTDRFGALITHEVYDPAIHTWTSAPSIPMRLCGFAAASYKDNIFVFGGEQGWAVSPYVFSYNTKTKRWSRLPNLAEARYAGVAVTMHNRIHFLGGNRRMFSDNFSTRHDIYIP